MSTRTQHKDGYELSWETDDTGQERIVTVTYMGGRTIRLGDTVTHNGYWQAMPKNENGTVIQIVEPYTQGRTDDILIANFGGPAPIPVKFADIGLSPR